MIKQYVGRHRVHYRSANEGKSIWGVGEIATVMKSGGHVWLHGMALVFTICGGRNRRASGTLVSAGSRNDLLASGGLD
jgi:hypothetical protein